MCLSVLPSITQTVMLVPSLEMPGELDECSPALGAPKFTQVPKESVESFHGPYHMFPSFPYSATPTVVPIVTAAGDVEVAITTVEDGL
jgi:hypothetical protein